MLVSMSSNLILRHGSLLPHRRSDSFFDSWGLRRDGDHILQGTRSNSRLVRILPHPNASAKSVIMVDPLEAKKLATKQYEEIKARDKLQRKREIEAINGAWATIGLTVGLLIEFQTGKSIPDQVLGYWSTILNIFVR